MKFDPDRHKRRSIRLKNYDYTSPGAYFITICIHNREPLLGDIVNGKMIASVIGDIVANEWVRTASQRGNVQLDEWILMPNHFHGILVIGGGDGRGMARHAPTEQCHAGKFGKPVSGSLPVIVGAFKSASTRAVNRYRQSPGTQLWQRNYWEHIIGNEQQMHYLRGYIVNNPVCWQKDVLYSADNQDQSKF